MYFSNSLLRLTVTLQTAVEVGGGINLDDPLFTYALMWITLEQTNYLIVGPTAHYCTTLSTDRLADWLSCSTQSC